jgi:ABC-type transporter Mla subunit MlaD
MKTLMIYVLAFTAAVSLTSCGRSHSQTQLHADQDEDPDFSAALTTAAGLRQGDQVLFLGTAAGHVESIKPRDTGLIVEIKLSEAFRGHVHRGGKARAIRDERTGSTRLVIVGGNDTAAPPLQESDVVPEASLIETVAENCAPGAATRAKNTVREKTIGFLDATARELEKLKEHLTEKKGSDAAASPTPEKEN